jgi:hypothetical protein
MAEALATSFHAGGELSMDLGLTPLQVTSWLGSALCALKANKTCQDWSNADLVNIRLSSETVYLLRHA